MHYANKYVYGLSLGHLLVDFNQGALAALLPVLITQHHFNYAIAATLVFFMNLISSVVQPLFGVLSDQHPSAWILPVAVLIAAAGFCMLGSVSTYNLLIVGVLISGIGVAAYHPDAAKLVNGLADQTQGRNMSLFSFGGNVGFAIGPTVLTLLINQLGTKGINWLLLPACLSSAILVFTLPKIKHEIKIKSKTNLKTNSIQLKQTDDWKSFSLLSVILFGRSIIFYGLNTFLVLYWIHILNQSRTLGSLALSLLFIVGSIGTLIGGALADKIGYAKLIRISFTLLPFALIAMLLTKNIVLELILLLPVGLLLFMPYSSMVILGQQYLPNKMGLASGVTLGLAVSVGGIASPVLGNLADMTSLSVVMWTLTGISILPAVFAYLVHDIN